MGSNGAADRRLDIRDIPPHERLRRVLEAFDGLTPGESLLVVARDYPLPLVLRLADDRFGQFTGVLRDGGTAWEVEISRR